MLVEGIVKNQFIYGLSVMTTSLAVQYLDRRGRRNMRSLFS
jgi:hypothetical protein